MPDDPNTPLPHPTLWRRLAALSYDLLLLLAVLFFAFIPVALLLEGSEKQGGFNPFTTLYLLWVCFLFFGWFWTHGGQTLGMRAWRLRVQTLEGDGLDWPHALMRFLAGLAALLPFGLGFLWSLLDHDRLALHDKFSKTVLVVLPKKKGS
jgi:uncharacterized RDD family membrane protein YckC